MLVLILPLLVALTNCLGSAAELAVKGNLAEWSLPQADSCQSSALNVQGPPPSTQTIRIPHDGRTPNRMEIRGMVLTSSGRLIWTSNRIYNTFNEDPIRDNAHIFGRDFQSDKNSWAQSFKTDGGLSGLVVSPDALTAWTTNWEKWEGFPMSFNVQNGKITKKFDTNIDRLSTILACPNTPSTFIFQNETRLNWADPRSTKLGLIPGFDAANGQKYQHISSDATGSRVAHVVSVQGFAGNITYLALEVYEAQQTSGVEFTKLWTFPFRIDPNFLYYFQVSTPVWTNDGRLLVAQNFQRERSNLYFHFLDAKTGNQVAPPLHIPADIGLAREGAVSITSDGNYALIKGRGIDREHFYNSTYYIIVVSLKDRTWTWRDRYRTSYYNSEGLRIAVDEENSIAYSANYCTLTAFCLQNPKVTHWNVTLCDDWSKTGATTMVLGKYSGGQRRIFVGMSGFENITQVNVFEPPAYQC